MSGMKPNDAKEQEHTENKPGEQVNGDFPVNPEHMDEDGENSMTSDEEEEEKMKKKYGGMLPKKPPLISKDHECAVFDSAGGALGKQGGPVGQKPKGPLEALQPKLQPTPHQQARSRRSAYAPMDGEDGGNATIDDPISNE